MKVYIMITCIKELEDTEELHEVRIMINKALELAISKLVND